MVNEGKFDALIIEGTGKDKLKIGGGDIVIEGKGFDRNQYILDVRDRLTDVVRRWNPESIKGEQGGKRGFIGGTLTIECYVGNYRVFIRKLWVLLCCGG